jgi:fluoroacetyl-CoA thioesterase
METGVSATVEFTVGEADTAAALGSGDLPVLGTPGLLAWCEAATCAAVADSLSAGQTSVGTRISLEHLAASPVGERVEVQATVVYVDGRLVRFQVAASHVADGKLVSTGEVTRVVVDRDRFLARVSPAADGTPAG